MMHYFFKLRENTLKKYNLFVAIGSLLASILGFLPFLLTLSLNKRYQQEEVEKILSIKLNQMQMVQKISQVISICSAIAMLSYGDLIIIIIIDIIVIIMAFTILIRIIMKIKSIVIIK